MSVEMSIEQISKKNGYIHRVGSITAGISLILVGIFYILYEFRVIADIATVLRFWPIILIGLGIEILWGNSHGKNMIYDKGAVFILVMMTLFSMMMACVEQAMRYI